MKPPRIHSIDTPEISHCLPPLEAHGIWAESYDSDPNPLLALEFRILEPRVRGGSALVSLDVGCGTGRWLSRLRGPRAFGVDLSSEMLAMARRKPALGGRLVLGDASLLPFAGAVSDQTLCSFCIGYIAEVDALWRELARVTHPGGHVFVSDFHPSAHSRGWRRSFRVESRTIEIQSYRHRLTDIIQTARAAGLEAEELLEPAFDEPERAIFRSAGKERVFEEMKSDPAIFVAIFRKR